MRTVLLPEYPVYDSEGRFIQLVEPDFLGCRDEDYFRLTMSYCLDGAREQFIIDSLSRNYYTYKNDGQRVENEITYPASLDYISPALRTLNGRAIDIDSVYTDYLILRPFSKAGKSKLEVVTLREMLDDVRYLESKYEIDIELVLIIMDEMDWHGTG